MTPTTRPYKATYYEAVVHFRIGGVMNSAPANKEPCEVVAYTARSYRIKLTRYRNKFKTVRRRSVRGLEQAGIAETSNYNAD